jgi:hypothetical protein
MVMILTLESSKLHRKPNKKMSFHISDEEIQNGLKNGRLLILRFIEITHYNLSFFFYY